MIALDFNSKTASKALPLDLSASKDKPKVSFSDLLKSLNTKGKSASTDPLVLAINSEEKSMKSANSTNSAKNISKSEVLATLLKGTEKIVAELKDEPLLLNPKLVTAMSKDEVKSLIFDAKKYLKTKIEDSDGYKKSEIKEMPTTLKGLVEVAQKFGIDVSKVSVEDVKLSPKIKIDSSESLLDGNITQESSKPQESTKMHTQQDKERQNIFDKIISKSQEEPLKEIKTTPLFKTEALFERATTEQFVNSKKNIAPQSDQKTTKDRSDETLKLLLRAEKPAQSDVVLTSDFSVATAKVIAPKAKEDAVVSLEQLLQVGAKTSSESTTKKESDENLSINGVASVKSDSLELKLNEAKQMIKYLSNDIKTAVDDYRSPFTRVKVQLNPQNLGEIDLTIVQRGKNLHVNLSSNNSAINTLALNINELKTQLNNSGINSATINFSNGADSGANSFGGGQQQQRQNEQKAKEEYGYFANESVNEEILSSLEIVVPRYI
ncbi:flagellar hook-length control protein FliK [Sulfurimonas sp.]|uniref:flagellar hook-length control protein FliK n=1 Tax=Sulfurimonas sp. TaxID=2022749 RepID=UPI0025EE9FE5|nr:flagellar hook-length control protein FliK [Sulfurimonas sp.]MDD5157770.1 flagellar hook-length control protein FliK [Sulfurimonas sp.]